jgi:hypothetical protein
MYRGNLKQKEMAFDWGVTTIINVYGTFEQNFMTTLDKFSS